MERIYVEIRRNIKKEGVNGMNIKDTKRQYKKIAVLTLICGICLFMPNKMVEAAKVKKVESIQRIAPSFYTRTIAKGKTAYLKVRVLPDDADNQDLKWTSSNKKVVTVSSTGKIKGIKRGNAIITAAATDGSKKKVIWKVTVGIPTTDIQVKETTLTLNAGETYEINPTVVPKNASNTTLYYHSEQEEIAAVNQKGVITAKAAGTTKIDIDAKDGRSSAEITVTVKEEEKEQNLVLNADTIKQNGIITGGVYDNIVVDSSVGNIKIILLNTTVSDTLTLQGGGLYQVELMNCQVNQVIIEQERQNTASVTTAQIGSGISNSYPSAAIAPSFITKSGTKVEQLLLRGNGEVHCLENSKINGIKVDASEEVILAKLENISGTMEIQGAKTAMLDLISCQLENVTVNGSVKLHDEVTGIGSSNIKKLTLSGEKGYWTIDTAANSIVIESDSLNGYAEFSRSVDTITNNGSNTSLSFVNGSGNTNAIRLLQLAGYGGMIRGDKSVSVGMIQVQNSGTIIERENLNNPQIIIGTYANNTIVDGELKYPGSIIR